MMNPNMIKEHLKHYAKRNWAWNNVWKNLCRDFDNKLLNEYKDQIRIAYNFQKEMNEEFRVRYNKVG